MKFVSDKLKNQSKRQLIDVYVLLCLIIQNTAQVGYVRLYTKCWFYLIF